MAVISESLAKQSFGTSDPLGKQIQCGLDSDKWMTVVGVVGDVRQESPAEKPGPTLYMPLTQHPFYANQIHVVLRTEVEPLTLMNAVHEDCAGGSVDRDAFYHYGCDGGQVDCGRNGFARRWSPRLPGIGLLLAMLGVYGTVAYTVAQRSLRLA